MKAYWKLEPKKNDDKELAAATLRSTAVNGPSRRYGGYFELCCFKELLWDVQGAS